MTMDAIGKLKQRARVLQNSVSARNDSPLRSTSLFRVKKLPELSSLTNDEIVESIQRRHCLAVLARELGFSGWPHAQSVLSGDLVEDYGPLLYPKGSSAYWNIWFAHLDEALDVRSEHGGYLLPYKKQFFIVDDHFIASLGLAQAKHEWQVLGNNWCAKGGHNVRSVFYAQLVDRFSAPIT